MNIRVLHTLAECQHIWNILCTHEVLYDEWDFRMSFYRWSGYSLSFYVAYDNEKPVALLPLMFDTDEKKLVFFGANYMDINRIFYRTGYDECIPLLLKYVSETCHIRLSQNHPFIHAMPIEDWNYYFSLEHIHSLDDFFQHVFSSKRRKNMRRIIRTAEKAGIYIVENNYTHLKNLIDLNIQRFKSDSSFSGDSYFPKTFAEILELPLDISLLSFCAGNGQVVGVTIAVYYKTIWYLLAVGSDSSVENIGHYMVLMNIQKALELRSTAIDLGSDDCGWKERWHAQKSPIYVYAY